MIGKLQSQRVQQRVAELQLSVSNDTFIIFRKYDKLKKVIIVEHTRSFILFQLLLAIGQLYT